MKRRPFGSHSTYTTATVFHWRVRPEQFARVNFCTYKIEISYIVLLLRRSFWLLSFYLLTVNAPGI